MAAAAEAAPLESKDGEEDRIRAAFDLFDRDRNGEVQQEEISNIMRYLGAYPSEKAMVENVLPDMREPGLVDADAKIKWERFEKKMKEVLASREFAPDPADRLMKAFRVLDVDRKGYLESEVLYQYLTTKGAPFREKEIDSFMSVAKDVDTGAVYYEDYVSLISEELERE
eukprot:PLAT13931.1.p1 GENE.PLAT13931.1~~PLAT13931.1.p1  ORF type:complete len:191 (+),score=57.33 PLAT13931.1:64-573(+)